MSCARNFPTVKLSLNYEFMISVMSYICFIEIKDVETLTWPGTFLIEASYLSRFMKICCLIPYFKSHGMQTR
jgi:hypothetical protein